MNQIAQLLFNHHSHVEFFLDKPDLIVYTEEDVIKILTLLGHPAPEWDEHPTTSLKDQLEQLRKEGKLPPKKTEITRGGNKEGEDFPPNSSDRWDKGGTRDTY